MTKPLPPGFTLDTPDADAATPAAKAAAPAPPPGFTLDAPAIAADAPAEDGKAAAIKMFKAGPLGAVVAAGKGLVRAGLGDSIARGDTDQFASALHTGADFVDQTIQAHSPLAILSDLQAKQNPHDAGAQKTAEALRDPLGAKRVADQSLAVHQEINKDREVAQARVGGRPAIADFIKDPLAATEQGAAYYGNMGAESAPGMALALATRNPELASDVLGATSGAQQYADDRSQGVGRGAAALDALVNAAAEKTGEEVSLPFVMDDAALAAEKSGLRRLLHATAAEAGQEVPTQIVQTQSQDLATGQQTSVPDQLLGALDAGVVGGLMGAGGHVAHNAAPLVRDLRGPLQRVADAARGQQQQFSADAEAARARAAAATQFTDTQDLSAQLETLRSQAQDQTLAPEQRASALEALQALVEQHHRMLPPPDGFTVDSAGNTTRGAPRARAEIAPGARAPGDFGPGMTEQAPGPKPQPSYAADTSVLEGDRTTTSGKPFATQAGASRHLKSAFDGKGQLTQVDGGWVVRPPLAPTTPAAAASGSAAPTGGSKAAPDQARTGSADQSAGSSESAPAATPASTEGPPHKSADQSAAPSAAHAPASPETPATTGEQAKPTPPAAPEADRSTPAPAAHTGPADRSTPAPAAHTGPDSTGSAPGGSQATPAAAPAATGSGESHPQTDQSGSSAAAPAAQTAGEEGASAAAPGAGAGDATPAQSQENWTDRGGKQTRANISESNVDGTKGGLYFETRSGSDDENPLGLWVTNDGTLKTRKQALTDGSGPNVDLWTGGTGQQKAQVLALLRQRGEHALGSAERNGIDAQIKAIVTGAASERAPSPESAAPGASPTGAAAATATPAAPGSAQAAPTGAEGSTSAGSGASTSVSGVTGHGENTTATDEGNAKAAAIAAAAATSATHPGNDTPAPTEAQKEAGNYKKGHARVAGLDISIENPAGTKRNEAWPALAHHYGYIKGTIGKDKDHVDVFLTEHAHDESRPVFVVDQTVDGKFDEHKVILGAADVTEARKAYLANYSPDFHQADAAGRVSRGAGAITQMTHEQFKAWVKDQTQTVRPATEAKHADAPTLSFSDSKAGESAAETARNAALDANAEHATLPWPTKGWKGAPAAQISVAKGDNGWHFKAGYQTNSTGHGGPYSTHHYASAAEARGAAVDAIRARLPKNPEGVEKQHVARINDWLAKQDAGTGAAPGKGPLTLEESQQITGPAMLRLQVQLGIAAKGAANPVAFQYLKDSAKAELGPAVRTMLAAESSARAESMTEPGANNPLAPHLERAAARLAELQAAEREGRIQPDEPATKHLLRLGYSIEQIERMPGAQRTHISSSVQHGPGPGVSPVTYPVPDAPTSAWKAYDAKVKAAYAKAAAEAPPPKLTAKEKRAAAAEAERSVFAALTNDPSWIGKSLEAIKAEVRARATAEGASTINPGNFDKLAAGIHKTLAKNAKALEQQKHRDPAVYKAAVDAAAGARAVEARSQFEAGFAHAMAGKTKSSMVGDRLPDLIAGYEAAIAWRKTEEGKAFFEGRPVAKLKNTGADLRRFWEQAAAELKAKQSSVEKAWPVIERLTNRAAMFAPLLKGNPPPGFQAYVGLVRDGVMPFKEWLENRYADWYGSAHYRSKYSKAKTNTEYMLSGDRYPGGRDHRNHGIDGERFQTDEQYRIDVLQIAAQQYLDHVMPLVDALSGATSVAEAAQKLDDAFFKPGLAAEYTRQHGRNYDQRKADREKGVADLPYAQALSPAGKALDSSVWTASGRHGRELWQLTPTASTTRVLIEKEQTYELPNKATPLVAPKLDHVTREGLTDQRKGRNVTPDEFKKVFGFADVGFGKWVGSKQDQDHLNYAFDAFMDLAHHLGIQPSDVGFGGRLHFTIGALGHGSKAAAHFAVGQPHPDGGTVEVINLTNTKGDGTVYHEWIHALDHYLGSNWGGARKLVHDYFVNARPTVAEVEAYANRFLFGGTYWKGDKNGDKVKAASKGMTYYKSHAQQRTAYKTNADKLGADYWGNEHELLARAAEAWAADTLGGTNTYLVNPGWVGDGAATPEKGYRGTPYPSGHERALFAQVFTALKGALSFAGGQPVVDLAKFKAALPEEVGDQRRRELEDVEAMRAYYQQEQARRAGVEAEKEAQRQAKARAEQDALDALAASALDSLAPIVDPPPPSQAMGELTEADLSALFDEAAAELREQAADQPSAPPPGFAADVAPTAGVAPPRAGAPAAAPTAKGETAAELVASAAKLGVKGADEALKGLAAIFGAGPGRLNSFPSGFDEESYQKAKPHFTAALQAFQEAGKTLKDLFQLLIQTYGDGIKEYAVRFARDLKLGNSLGQATSASSRMADTVAARLNSGGALNWRELFEFADEAWGGTQAEGTYTPKDAYDALEAGVNRYLLGHGNAFSPDTDRAGAQLVVKRLQQLTERLPTQTKRTAEQDEFQQFSTVPPLAFLANWAAGVTAADTVLEPSAGIGGLAVFAKIAGAKLELNELSSRRAAVLQDVFPGSRVFHENAEQIDNILPDDVTPTVVVMNPPFSASAGRMQGERDTRIGAQHVTQALARLPAGGRLVAIVGDGMRLDAPRFRAWWREVQDAHTVRAVIPVSGKGYAKYGTTFDNVLLVIDKVASAERVAPVVTPVEDYTDLVGLLSEIRDVRPAAAQPLDTSTADSDAVDAAESARAEPVPEGERDAAAGAAAAGAAAVGAAQPGSGSRVGTGRGGRGAQAGGRGPGGARGGAGRPGAAVGTDAEPGGNAPAADRGGQDSGGHATGVVLGSGSAAAAELTDSTFENYQPQRLQIAGSVPHPGPLVQSAAMASVLPPRPTYTPNLPKETITEGKLSIAQLEAVVYAGQAHSELLPDENTRRGFFIGDGTGVGKGREIGGILLDNLRQGRRKGVWVTEKQDLEKDARRDFGAVGGDPGVIFNHNKTAAAADIAAKDGILFTTYDTLSSGAKFAETGGSTTKPFKKGAIVRGVGGPYSAPLGSLQSIDHATQTLTTKLYGQTRTHAFAAVGYINGDAEWRDKLPKPKPAGGPQSRLDQLVKWLGPDYDGVIAFDEAHNAGNAVAMKGERGATKPSAKALSVVELQKRLPKARVVYVSATGATTVNNLAYAERLGAWGSGTPFASVQEFVAEMTAGGLATMELVARDLKQMGAYLARSLSFDGVTYSRLQHELSPLQRDIYDRLAEAWQVVLANMNEALELTGATENGVTRNSNAVGAARSAFWGTQQRFFNQVITSMQMPSVLAQIHADLAAGDAVVLQLVNTNEAQQERALAAAKDAGEESLEDLDLTPRDALIGMVRKAFPVVQMQTELDPDSGKKVSRPVLDSTGKPVENKAAVAQREKLIKDLEAIAVPDGPLEALLNEFGPELVAEVTGRSQRTYMATDEDGNRKLKIEKRGSASNDKDAAAFMADKKRILVFSDAGGTGYSFHADNTKANRRHRQHYLVQPGWRADKAVQGLGRTHRTNEASQPHYRLVATDIPAHKRFLSAIARRLDMLGAMTKGQRDTANQGLFSEKDNLESKYATQAVPQLLNDIKAGQVDGVEIMDFLKQLGLDGLIDPDTGWIPDTKYPPTRQFLNRMLSLQLDLQEKVFDAFIQRMEEKVEVAAKRGELDAGMQTLKALSTRIVQDEAVYTDPRTGAETRYVELELTLPQHYYAFPTLTSGIDWLVNKTSGKVWGRTKSGTATLSTGEVVDRYRMYSTSGTTVKDAREVAGAAATQHYTAIDEAAARALWDKENAEKPETVTRTKHMIVGAMLPIWDRIKTEGTLQVMRTQTSDGQRLLGKLVLPKDVAEIRQRLNVGHPAAKMAPAELMAAILKGATAKLANGWTITRAKVSDELRIELKTPALYGPAMTELKDLGVIAERIDWRERTFIPTGANGVPVLQGLLKSKPVVDLTGGETAAAVDEDEGHALLRRRDEAGRFAKGMPVEAVQAIVDRISSQWQGLKAAGFTIHVHDTFEHLPPALQREALRQGSQPHQTLGLFRGNQLHIVAANARKGAAGVEETIFHEAYGHAGLRLIFGRGTQAEMVRISKAMGGLDGMLRYARANGIDLSDYVRDITADPTLSHDQKLGVLMDELLAHLAERGEPTLKQRVLELLGKVKEWLRDNGFAELAKYDGADLARLLQRSRQAVQGTGTRVRRNAQVGGAVAQQRAAAFDQEALDAVLAEHGEPVASTLDAERRWNAGERLFGTHEQAEGEATEITSHAMLRGYEPDQLLALPRALAAQLGVPDTRRRDAATTPDTPGFKDWFGDSKVTTASGRPLVVFHGTGEGFWAFSKEHLATATSHMSSPLGFFFDQNIAKAEAYARNAARNVPADERVIDAYLSIQNPKVMALKDLLAIDNLEEARALRRQLMRAGYDGIHLADNSQWVAFEPSQIKSASFNNGNFDSRDDDIRFSRAPTTATGPTLDALEEGVRGSSQRAFDRIKSAAENWRPALLGALTLRHLGELGAKIQPLIAKYQGVVDQMNVDRNDLMHKAAGTADEWAALQANQPRAAVEMASLMHDTTLAGVDPSRDFVPGMLPASRLGPAEPITPAAVNARIQKLTGERARTDNPEVEHRLDAQIQGLRDALAEEAARRRQYPDLVARWTDLPREAQQMYVRVRDAYAEMSQHTLDALVARILKLEATEAQKEALVDRMRLSFEEAKIHAPYFPLARFGDFWTSAEDASGERAFFMYESHRAWKQAQAQLKRDGYTILDTGRKLEKQRLIDGASGAFVAQVQTLLEDANVDDDTRDEVYQLYLRTLPDLSARKHFIHRKGIEGYSNDALRAFGSNMFHGAFQIARLRHTQELANLMAAMEKAPAALTDPEDKQKAGALYNEMVKRHDWILNPRDSALVSKISALNFIYYLGATPAAAVVNLTQTAMIALPVLGARYGYRGANRELLRAMKLAGKQQLSRDPSAGFLAALSGDEAEAYKTWIRLGIIDVTQAHALAEIGQTDSTQFNRTAHQAMAVTSALFHRAEMLNRQATALAAYRLARRGGLGHEAATDYAGKATLEAHFDYSNANRARFMQSGTAKVLLAFRQYSLNMSWFLARNAQQSFAGLTAAERSEARQKLLGALGMTGLFAGATGLPLMWAVFGAFNMLHALFGDDDDPWDAETAFKNWAVETFGHWGGQTLTQGLVNSTLGVDLSSRVSLNNLWLREADRDLEGKAQYDYYLEQAAGPVGGAFANMARGTQLIHEGQLYRGIETMVPKALKDAMKAARYATQGVNTLRGDPLVPDVSLSQQIAQFAGFTPAEVAERQDANSAAMNYQNGVEKRRGALLDGFAMALRMEDDGAMEAGLRKIQAWNGHHPEYPIDQASIQRSLAARARYSAQAQDGLRLNPRLRDRALREGAFAGE